MPLLAVGALAIVLASPARAAVSYTVTFADPGGPQASFESAIRSNVYAAGMAWAPYFGGDAVIDIVVAFDSSVATVNSGSVASSRVGTDPALNIFEQGAALKARTGIDVNGSAPDALITIGTDYLWNELFFDPAPGTGVPVPTDRTDAISIFTHELAHVFAFNGWLDYTSGALPGNYASSYDALTTFSAGNFFFVGAQAMSIYGGPVPLTFGSGTHLGNAGSLPGVDLLPDLMNGVAFYRGTRYGMSALDVAMIHDVGAFGDFAYIQAVPEPTSMILMLCGLAAVGVVRLRRRAA